MQKRRQDHARADRLRPRLRGPGARPRSQSAEAGDIVALVGLENIEIGDTVSDPRFAPGTAPRGGRRADAEDDLRREHLAAGRPGRQVSSPAATSASGCMKELQKNVALRVEPIAGTEQFSVSGRGILHLSVLIETMRREGFELSIGKPHVILHEQRRRDRGAVRVAGGRGAREPDRPRDGNDRPAPRATGRHAVAQRLFLHGLFDSGARADRPADAAA